MKCLYHRCPEKIVGSRLVPLNQLKQIAVDRAIAEESKYDDRPELKKVRIPILDCLWNDVLHFATIHPKYIYKTLTQVGAKDVPKRAFYKIPISMISEKPAVYFQNSLRPNDDYEFLQNDFSPFDPNQYEELTELPDSSREYYANEIATERRPFLYARLPHVLVQGELDVSSLEVVLSDE